jgi:HEAT repeat protein
MSETPPSRRRDPLHDCLQRLAAAELGSPDWEAACHDLARLDHTDVEPLLATLGTVCRSLRAGVVRTLKQLGAAVYYDLIEAVSADHPAPIRATAAGLLYGVIQQGQVVAADAVPALAAALADSSPQLRQRAAVTLELIGPDAVEAVAGLIRAVSDDEPYVREWAAHALAAVGSAAVEAVPALTEALLDEDPNVRQAASDAIDAIQGGSHGR